MVLGVKQQAKNVSCNVLFVPFLCVGLLARIYKRPAQLVMIAWADQSCRDSNKQATIKGQHRYRVSDQLSDGLIFGRLFQANEKFSTVRSCANL